MSFEITSHDRLKQDWQVALVRVRTSLATSVHASCFITFSLNPAQLLSLRIGHFLTLSASFSPDAGAHNPVRSELWAPIRCHRGILHLGLNLNRGGMERVFFICVCVCLCIPSAHVFEMQTQVQMRAQWKVSISCVGTCTCTSACIRVCVCVTHVNQPLAILPWMI